MVAARSSAGAAAVPPSNPIQSFSRDKHYSNRDRYLESPLNVIHMHAFITALKINIAVIVSVSYALSGTQ
jgi:hypothetical protein